MCTYVRVIMDVTLLTYNGFVGVMILTWYDGPFDPYLVWSFWTGWSWV